MNLESKEGSFLNLKIRLNSKKILLAAIFLASIQQALVLRIGAGFQFWLLLLLLLATVSVFEKQFLIFTSRSWYFISFLLFAFFSTLLSIGFLDFPDLSGQKMSQVQDITLKMVVDFLRLFASLLGVAFIIQFTRDKNYFVRCMRAFAYGSILPVLYGFYCFIVSLFGYKWLLIPGTWGRVGSRVASKRAASFFYEPSQFGFYCAVIFLFILLLYEARILSKKECTYFSVGLIGGLALSVSGSGLYSLIIGLAVAALFNLRVLIKTAKMLLVFSPLAVAFYFFIKDKPSITRYWRHKFFQSYKANYFESAVTRVQDGMEVLFTLSPENPILGTGIGSAFFFNITSFYHKLVFETGLVGVVFFLLVLLAIAHNLIVSWGPHTKLKAWYAGLCACFFAGLFKYNEINHFWTWIVTYFLVFGIREIYQSRGPREAEATS